MSASEKWGLFPWGVEERGGWGIWQLPVMKELSPSVTRGWVRNPGNSTEVITLRHSITMYLKTLFQTSKQKILSQACSLSPVDSHDEYWYLINEFVFFLYFETVLINALMMMLI